MSVENNPRDEKRQQLRKSHPIGTLRSPAGCELARRVSRPAREKHRRRSLGGYYLLLSAKLPEGRGETHAVLQVPDGVQPREGCRRPVAVAGEQRQCDAGVYYVINACRCASEKVRLSAHCGKCPLALCSVTESLDLLDTRLTGGAREWTYLRIVFLEMPSSLEIQVLVLRLLFPHRAPLYFPLPRS